MSVCYAIRASQWKHSDLSIEALAPRLFRAILAVQEHGIKSDIISLGKAGLTLVPLCLRQESALQFFYTQTKSKFSHPHLEKAIHRAAHALVSERVLTPDSLEVLLASCGIRLNLLYDKIIDTYCVKDEDNG